VGAAATAAMVLPTETAMVVTTTPSPDQVSVARAITTGAFRVQARRAGDPPWRAPGCSRPNLHLRGDVPSTSSSHLTLPILLLTPPPLRRRSRGRRPRIIPRVVVEEGRSRSHLQLLIPHPLLVLPEKYQHRAKNVVLRQKKYFSAP